MRHAHRHVVQRESLLASALASRKKVKAKPERSTKQTGAGARQRGLQIWRESKLNFNSDYQKQHAQRRDSYEGREHWQKFLEALASDKPVKCGSCQLLREKVVRGGSEPSAVAAAAASIPIQDTPEQQAAGQQQGAGRAKVACRHGLIRTGMGSIRKKENRIGCARFAVLKSTHTAATAPTLPSSSSSTSSRKARKYGMLRMLLKAGRRHVLELCLELARASWTRLSRPASAG